jgi:hypothetical protein
MIIAIQEYLYKRIDKYIYGFDVNNRSIFHILITNEFVISLSEINTKIIFIFNY